MNLPTEIGEEAINKVMEQHPAIGKILEKYEIGCVTCGGPKGQSAKHKDGDAGEQMNQQVCSLKGPGVQSGQSVVHAETELRQWPVAGKCAER